MREEVNNFKRGRIIEVASHLFYERGFVGTTLDAIAEELSVTKPFVYQFFKSKHEILAALIGHEIESVIKLLDEAYSEALSPQERLGRFVKAWVRKNVEMRKIVVIFWQEQNHFTPKMQKESRNLQKTLNARLAELIEDGVKAGVFSVGNPTLSAFALTGILQWVPRWYRPEGVLDVEQIADYFADIALRVVGVRISKRVGGGGTAEIRQ